MKIVNYTYARKNFRSLLDDTVKACEPTCIVSKNNQVVLIGKSEYDKMIKVISNKGLTNAD